MSHSYTYTLSVVEDGDGYTARLGDEPTPLRGYGESPLQAVRALCETLREWPISGANRWLDTDSGVKLAREFVPGFEPSNSGASS